MNVTVAPQRAQARHSALADSRDLCARITRQRARNFYYGLKLLPQPKRSAMFALYAYLRLIDDIADATNGEDEDDNVVERSEAADTADRANGADATALPENLDLPGILERTGESPLPISDSSAGRLLRLRAWQNRTRQIIAAGSSPTRWSGDGATVWPAFARMVADHGVPVELFDQAIEGQCQDLEFQGFETADELLTYCRRVAGTVGVASLHIWGFDGSEAAQTMAIDRGIAFQLTNILRDLREDAGRGRVYLSHADLDRAHLTRQDLLAAREDEAFDTLMRQQIERALDYYARSSGLEERIERDSRSTLVAMTEIYRGILEKIAADPRRVLHERISLSLVQKLRIGWKAARVR